VLTAGRPYLERFVRHLIARSGVEHLILVGSASHTDLFADLDVIVHRLDLIDNLDNLESNLIKTAAIVCFHPTESFADQHGRLFEALGKHGQDCRWMLVTVPEQCPFDNVGNNLGWTTERLRELLLNSGFSNSMILGRVPIGGQNLAQHNIVALAGRDLVPTRLRKSLRIAAVLNVFNEADIIAETVNYLVDEGVEVHIFDDWSDDGTYEIAQSLCSEGKCKAVQRIFDRPSREYRWADILANVENYCAKLDVDWIIHYDADEIRISPWPDLKLGEAITWVDSCGYNAIDFTVLHFRYTEVQQYGPETTLKDLQFFEFGRQAADFVQIKAWRKTSNNVSLAASGGHNADFVGRRVFPLNFLTRHYPLRSQVQAEKKLFLDRIPRIENERRGRGWHVQYNYYELIGSIRPWSPHELLYYDPKSFDDQYFLERLSRIGLEESRTLLPSDETVAGALRSFAAKNEKVGFDNSPETIRALTTEVGVLQEALVAQVQNTEAERTEWRQHTKNLETEKAGLEGHAQNLAQERAQLQQHVRNLEQERADLHQHTKNLETEREELRVHSTNLESNRAKMSQHAQSLEEDREAISHRRDELESQKRDLEVAASRFAEFLSASEMRVDLLVSERDRIASELERLLPASATLTITRALDFKINEVVKLVGKQVDQG
jgi:glycosyltransferase involved in cell wall biosynthesis/predicted nuclease with TOPRIM domain